MSKKYEYGSIALMVLGIAIMWSGQLLLNNETIWLWGFLVWGIGLGIFINVGEIK